MKKLFYLTIFFLCGHAVFSQTIKGKVISQDGNPLVNSTVLLVDTKDSTTLSFGRTKEGGLFELKAKSKDRVILQITNVGHIQYSKFITPETDLDLGTIIMDPVATELAEFVVKGERAAVTVNKDTIEYNADAFRVQENAMAEDLLKKMDGIEVERDGTVSTQGEQVTRILVNNKEFFGRDPKIALKNIPANAIKTVQVFDKKSDRAEFTGIDDGEQEKTINFVLKKDKANLGFGRVTAGGGVDGNNKGRYNLGASYNTFKDGNQISFLGNGNNINQQGFSFQESLTFSGAGRGMGGGGGFSIGGGGFGSFGGRTSGLLRNWSGGANFNNKLSKKTELNGSYFYSNNSTNMDRESESTNFVGDLKYSSLGGSTQNNLRDSHRFNTTLNTKINDKNTIRWVNRVDFGNSSNLSNSQNREFDGELDSYVPGQTALRNSSNRVSASNGKNLSLNSQLNYQARFAKKGRTLSTTLSLGMTDNKTDGTLNAINGVFNQSAGKLDTTYLNQVNNQISKRFNYGAEFSYTEPINASNFLEFNYTYQKVNNDLNKDVYNIDGERRLYDTTLSNIYQNDYIYNRGGFNYRISKEKWNGNFGVALQISELNGFLELRDIIIKKTFRNPVYNSRVQYNFTNARSMDLTYNSNISEPSMTQLSPVPDNSNPLNIYVGNPNLKPQNSHNLRLNFRDFNQLKFTNFFAGGGIGYTYDMINEAIEIDPVTLERRRTPINYGNAFNVNANANYGFRIKPISTRISFNSSVNYRTTETLVNNLNNEQRTFSNTNTLRADYVLGDNFNLGASARINYNNNKYSQNTQLNANYVNQTYTTSLDWILPNWFSFNTTMDYAIYRYANSDDVVKVPIWNMAIFRTILKNKRAEVRFSANDLLGKNIVIDQSGSGNSFTETRTNSLGRYVLLTFTYNINGGASNSGRGSRGTPIIGF